MRKIIDECYGRAKDILEENKDRLELMKDALMEYETIDADQIDDIMNGNKPRPPADWSDSNNDDSGTSKKTEKDKVDSSSKIGGPASEH